MNDDLFLALAQATNDFAAKEKKRVEEKNRLRASTNGEIDLKWNSLDPIELKRFNELVNDACESELHKDGLIRSNSEIQHDVWKRFKSAN